jgi:glycosyltransferase involved in cell wall biosynthesis
MRLLIVSGKGRMADYFDFVKALNYFGVEAICVQDLKHCFLSESKPLHIVPFPKLLKLIKRFNPDIVMTDSPYYIPHMAKLVNRCVLFHMRGEIWSESQLDIVMYPSIFARMYTNYLDTIKTPSIKKADLILPNSKWLQKQVKQHLPNHPTQVLYVGINAEKWVPNPNTTFNVKHPAVVGVFPFIIYAKVSGLLKFTRVIRKMPDVNFYFAGNGPYLNLIKRNCPPNMFLMGRVSRPEVKKLLESCDLFVHPSGLDALPRNVKEASLMEKPIIASNVGGIPEIVKNNQTGYLCNINDVDQWIERIRFLLDNPDVGRKFGKNAREFVANTFSWRRIAEDFLKNLGFHKE